jgi:hypothetical protein
MGTRLTNIEKDMIEKLQPIADKIISDYNLPIHIHFKRIRKGRAMYSGYTSIPLWCFGRGWEYALYYTIHEITHQIMFQTVGQVGHSKAFKQKEGELLAEHNIKLIYSRAYPKRLTDLNGNTIWDKRSNNVRR